MKSTAIGGATRVACVIGDPIAHSLSPAIHNAAFRHLAIDAVYVAYRVRPADLRHAVLGFRALDLLGINVTVPHKERVLRLLDTISPAAQSTGAVNTIVNRDGVLHGENTDVLGFTRALAEAGVELRGRRALVLGAGGAARAVLSALQAGGAAAAVIANRTRPRASQLARAFANGRKFACSVRSLDQLDDPQITVVTDLVINCTSIGLAGEPFLPLAYDRFRADCVFYDLIPRQRTDFLIRARATRHPVAGGLGMLLHQGAAAFELWTGEPAPIEVMRRALAAAIRQRH
ncbi:MAG TPA: shikimate dehydrogenase [Terriglobales bacterium]|nr:shikimate dehydrogenase [Terriglobales bacterium]